LTGGAFHLEHWTVESIIVADWNDADLTAFMATEWPRHDEPRGIRWEARDVLLVARSDEAPIGAARGVIVGGLGELKQLLVKKGRDRRGVGSRLLLEFEARCRAAGCHKIRLDTAEYQARPFYERHGYACVATLANDRFGKAVFIMEKHLP
jgi:GNAT superfamily N-acetyltransferase